MIEEADMTEQTDAAEVTVAELHRYLSTHGGAVDESDVDAMTDLRDYIAAREVRARAEAWDRAIDYATACVDDEARMANPYAEDGGES